MPLHMVFGHLCCFKFKSFSTPKKSKLRQNSKIQIHKIIRENISDRKFLKIDKIASSYTTVWRSFGGVLGDNLVGVPVSLFALNLAVTLRQISSHCLRQ